MGQGDLAHAAAESFEDLPCRLQVAGVRQIAEVFCGHADAQTLDRGLQAHRSQGVEPWVGLRMAGGIQRVGAGELRQQQPQIGDAVSEHAGLVEA